MIASSVRSSRPLHRLTTTLLLLPLIACAASPASDPDTEESALLSQRFQVTHDSSVIPEPGAFPEWRTEVVRHLIGGGFRDDSTLGFQPAHSAAILGDGSIFVASYRPPFVRYPANQVGVQHLGGAGEGPGEYRQIQWISRFRGDSLRIWDGALRRLATLDPAGRAIAEVRPTPQLRDGFEFWPSQTFEDGRLLAIGRRGAPPSTGNLILRGDLLLADSTHNSVHALAKDLPLGEMHVKEARKQPGMEQVVSIITPPFARRGLVAAGGHRWCYTWTGSPSLVCGSSDETQIVVARDTADIATVNETMLVGHLEDLGLLDGAGDQRKARIEGWKKHWKHQLIPRWSHMLMDNQERIWLQRFRNPLDSLERVLVVDRNFVPVGRLTLESGWQIIAAREQLLVVAKRTGIGGVVKVLSLLPAK